MRGAKAAAGGPRRRRNLATLRQDDLLAICCRIPYASHDALRCVCRRLQATAAKGALYRHRVAAGWDERALIVAGGGNTVYDHLDDEPEPERPETWGLIGKAWRALAPQPAPRCDCGVACVGSEMVCAGGTITTWEDEGWVMTTGVGDVVAYDAFADAWRDVDVRRGGGGLDARTSGACCVDPVRGGLVVLGGWRVVDRHQFRDAAVSSAQALPGGRVPAAAPAGPWAHLPALPQAVSNFASAVLGGKLYVAGGLRWEDDGRRRTPSDQLQVFDFATRAWSFGPRLPSAQYYGDGAAFGGRLYVCGGKNKNRKLSAAVAVFDPATGDWSDGPPLPGPRYYHSVLVHDKRLVCVGGHGNPLVLDTSGSSPAWVEDPAVLPPLPEGFEHPLLAPMVCSVPVG